MVSLLELSRQRLYSYQVFFIDFNCKPEIYFIDKWCNSPRSGHKIPPDLHIHVAEVAICMFCLYFIACFGAEKGVGLHV